MGQSTTRRRRYTKLWRDLNKIPNDTSDIIYSDTVPQDFSTTLKGPSTKCHMNKEQKKLTDFANRKDSSSYLREFEHNNLDYIAPFNNSYTPRSNSEGQDKARPNRRVTKSRYPRKPICKADTILHQPAKGCIRFMHINTGGINPQGGYAEYKLLLTNLQQTHSDVFSVNEHCLDTTQPKILKDLYDAGKATNKYGIQMFGSSSETFPDAFKLGCTMVGITGHLSGRIEEKSIDSKGRWT